MSRSSYIIEEIESIVDEASQSDRDQETLKKYGVKFRNTKSGHTVALTKGGKVAGGSPEVLAKIPDKMQTQAATSIEKAASKKKSGIVSKSLKGVSKFLSKAAGYLDKKKAEREASGKTITDLVKDQFKSDLRGKAKQAGKKLGKAAAKKGAELGAKAAKGGKQKLKDLGNYLTKVVADWEKKKAGKKGSKQKQSGTQSSRPSQADAKKLAQDLAKIMPAMSKGGGGRAGTSTDTKQLSKDLAAIMNAFNKQ